MALIVMSSRRSSGMFPPGYIPKTIRTDGDFPGFGNGIIPLCIKASLSVSGSGESWGKKSNELKVNNERALRLTGDGGGFWYEGTYSEGGKVTSNGSVNLTGTGMYLPYYYGYNWARIQSEVQSGNVIAWLQKGNRTGPDPISGYRFKSIKLGNIFPGFGADVIPITLEESVHGDAYGHGGSGQEDDTEKFSKTKKINNVTALSIDGKENTSVDASIPGNGGAGASISGTGTGFQLFLPYFYDFDYTAIQSGISSGTVSDWLERI